MNSAGLVTRGTRVRPPQRRLESLRAVARLGTIAGSEFGQRRHSRSAARHGTGANAMTIREVAERAGVGIATVSRTLHNSSQVSPETAARVRRAMQELGYRPNTNAQS